MHMVGETIKREEDEEEEETRPGLPGEEAERTSLVFL